PSKHSFRCIISFARSCALWQSASVNPLYSIICFVICPASLAHLIPCLLLTSSGSCIPDSAMLVKFPVKDVSLSHSRQVGNFKLSLNTGTLYWVTILILKKPFGLTIDFFSHLSHVTSNLIPAPSNSTA